MATNAPVVAPSSPSTTQTAAPAFQASNGYRNYVIWLLFTVYVFNFVDRQILNTLMQPIKDEFKFSDTQLGLLGGLAFAVLYSTLGIPIARWADRGNRVTIIAVSLFIWSLFTAVTGMARNFTHLLLARIMVGVGEAGCSPPAYSLISDYFEPKRRATAFSIYSMGIYGGVFVGFLVAGNVAQAYGWRAAFWVVGLPGVLLALLVKTTLREPPHGFSDTGRVAQDPPPVGEVLSTLWAKSSFRHLSIAAALHAFVGYGVTGFHAPFLMRSHAMNVAEVSNWLAFISVAAGLGGTFLGGKLADGYSTSRNDARWQVWIPGISTLLNVPLSLMIYLLPAKYAAIGFMLPALALGTMYLGPTFSITANLVSARERALAGALLLFIINLIGLGLGPLLTGMVSDAFKNHFAGQGQSELVASAEGLRYALAVMVCVNLWSAFHYMQSARTLRQDMPAQA
jgi:MFS family permease